MSPLDFSKPRAVASANVGLIHFDGEAANAFPAPLAIAAHPRRARAGSISHWRSALSSHGASVNAVSDFA